MVKKLIVCCDGTWQDSDGGAKEVPTNVTRITRALKSQDEDGISQIVYYQSGVGTGGLYDKILGGGMGDGLSENVREGYGFIAHNFHPGDTIHLFGFSRGAYTARSICGLITRLGVLTKRGMDNFYQIYQDYMNGKLKDENHLKDIRTRDNGGWVIPNVKVTTIGCWDTVGSLGIPTLPIPLLGTAISGVSSKKYSFHSTDLSSSVLNAFHALALDEARAPFQPTLWHKEPGNTITNLKQCWFPGVHTNVGGGYQDQEIADMTLAWMIQNHQGFLEFDPDYLDYITKHGPDSSKEWAAGQIYNSSSGLMRLAGSKVRTPGEYKGPSGETWWHTGETIHVSVRVRTKVVKGWQSKALNGWQWVDAQKCYVKGELTLKEDWLGDLEMELAGRENVQNLLGWALPGQEASVMKSGDWKKNGASNQSGGNGKNGKNGIGASA